MSERTAFVAGASGAVGRTVVRLAAEHGVGVIPHFRRPQEHAPPDAAVFPLDEHARLVEALRRATTVVQCIGTIRKRFAAGDTYESSDIRTTELLVEAAREAGSIDHVVLLSSAGAGRPVGAYLRAKARAEAIVTGSGLAYTIFRPGVFDGEGHHAPPGSGLVARLPGLAKFRPIRVETLARAMLHVVKDGAPLGAVLEGASLFRVVDEATA
jgi:uncharacterized protein YbjT (DUF2867 family)